MTCLLIFTTGSTGAPKAAVLAPENVLIQTIGLAVAFGLTSEDRLLVNLPPSHVGCVTKQLATSIYRGATSVLLPVFAARQSLEAIQALSLQRARPDSGALPPRVAATGLRPVRSHQPAARPLWWQDRCAPVSGEVADHGPADRHRAGAHRNGSFCTYTDLDATLDEIAAGIGYPSPLCPISIREPIQPDGRAGHETPPGVPSEICCAGPQLFLGYRGDPESTAQTLSQDGVCYTGDLGSYDAQGLHFAGRRKFVLKPKGYQVFPGDIEERISAQLRDRVADVACVGVEHEVFGEAIVAFVECRVGTVVSPAEVMTACAEIATYARPAHVEIVPAGMPPRTRIAKTDYLTLQERARAIVGRLRAEGQWA